MANASKGNTGERREQILQVALGLFAQYGMNNVTTRRIAQAVGISQPSLYAHFRNSDEIALELCERGFDALYARLSRVLEDRSNPLHRLHLIGTEYIRFGLEHPDIYRVAFMIEKPTVRRPPDEKTGLDAGLRAFGVLQSIVAEIYGADDERVAGTAQSLWASMHGLVSLLLARAEFPWIDREKLIADHVDMVCRGVSSGRPAGA